MSDNPETNNKNKRLKSALRDNLKKRKQFARKLGGEQTGGEDGVVRLRKREISTERNKE